MAQILVVDDSAVDLRIARQLLTAQADWNVLEAGDGEQALQVVEQSIAEGTSIDLVLTDLQMPKMNGLELVQQMRQEHPNIPVILMTAQGSEEIAVQALQAGAANYVPKRNLAHELVEIVGRVLDVTVERRSFRRLMGHLERNDCDFVLPNDLPLIASIVNFLRQEVRQMGICDEAEQYRVAVALEEALLNSYYHGNLEVSSKLREEDHKKFDQLAEQRRQMPPYQDRRIYVQASLSPEEARFVIRDEGPGFDPTQLPDPTDPENLARPCGRGVLLMRAFMDAIEFNATGNQVTMVKRGLSAVPAEAVEGGVP